jgi:hypothetical protein
MSNPTPAEIEDEVREKDLLEDGLSSVRLNAIQDETAKQFDVHMRVETNTPLRGREILKEIEEALLAVGVRPIIAQTVQVMPGDKEAPDGSQ